MIAEISQLDTNIAQLKISYEKYFARIVPREPLRDREDVERVIRRYSTQHLSNTALKFRFNNMVAKYNTLKQYWTRILKLIEEGRYDRRAGGGAMGSKPPTNSVANAVPKKSTPSKDDDAIKDVFNSYIEARKQCNENIQGLSFETMKKNLEAQKPNIAQSHGAKDVNLKVYIKDGKAKIAISPKG